MLSTKTLTKLPRFIKNLLWDIKIEEFDPHQFKEFLAVRVAEKGNLSCINWYFANLGKGIFLKTVLTHNEITERTRHFWRIYQEI